MAREWEEILAGQPRIFDNLSDEEHESITSKARRRRYRANSILFEQGDEVRGLYVIEHGSIRTFHTSISGKEITVGLWTEGDIIGAPDISFERTLLAAQARTESEVLIIDKNDVKDHIIEHSQFALNFVAALSFKVRWATTIFDIIATESLLSRVSQTIVHLAYLRGHHSARREIIINELTHQDIANMVGASRPSVSIAIRRLEQEGLIRSGRRRIMVRDLDGLASPDIESLLGE
ncbi:Crp/Fnr family transcriptional regulator [Ectothiorhodospiraceae bacterium WFHF3C12]|nr:Crp/Fnr family transcriptional regulator [Ectothiorhodospiraceae bacterium WFHF3C12]